MDNSEAHKIICFHKWLGKMIIIFKTSFSKVLNKIIEELLEPQLSEIWSRLLSQEIDYFLLILNSKIINN
jgi:hypothetical protein